MQLASRGALLPGHTWPRPHELLSSWLVRLAAQNGFKLHTFSRLIWPEGSIWNRDIDNSAPDELLNALALRSGQSFDRVRATTLKSYEGAVFERHNPNGNTPWILPLGIYHRTRTKSGLQFCPQCLDENPPYFRKHWRLAYVVVCPSHKRFLVDRCACGAPVNFHRGSLGDRHVIRIKLESIRRCYRCNEDLRRCEGDLGDLALLCASLDAQERCIIALREGQITIGHERLRCNLFFAGLRQLLQILATGRNSDLLRGAVTKWRALSDFKPGFSGKISAIERLPCGDRAALMAMVGDWFTDWPHSFIEACDAAGLTSTDICRNMQYVPYWLAAIAQEHFNRSTYSPTLPEIRNAIAYMRKRDLEVNRTSVSRLLGSSDAFRKRKLHYLLEPESRHDRTG